MIWGCDSSAPGDLDTHQATSKLTTKTTQCVQSFNYAQDATAVISSETDLTTKLTETTPSDWHVHIDGGWLTESVGQDGVPPQEVLQTTIEYEISTAEDNTQSLQFISCQPKKASATIPDAIHVPDANNIDISAPKTDKINQALDAAQVSAARPYKRLKFEPYTINEFIPPNKNPTAAEQTLITNYNTNMKKILERRTAVPIRTNAGDGGGGGDLTPNTSKSPCYDYLYARLRPLNKADDDRIYWSSIADGILRTHSDPAHVRFLTATDALITISLEYSPTAGSPENSPAPRYLLQGAALEFFLDSKLAAFEYKSQYNGNAVMQNLKDAGGIFYQRPEPPPDSGEGKNTNAKKTKKDEKSKAKDKAKAKAKKKEKNEDNNPDSSEPSDSTPKPQCAE